jgi:hypothetical protein
MKLRIHLTTTGMSGNLDFNCGPNGKPLRGDCFACSEDVFDQLKGRASRS